MRIPYKYHRDLIKLMLKIPSYTFHSNVYIEIDNSSVREEIGKVLEN